MSNEIIIDHLFRHQYGKMVSILTRIFGLSHLETIEDAVQDTFITAMRKWRSQLPENPEAWLTAAAKNRAIDLLRKSNADNERLKKIESDTSAIAFDNLFQKEQIEDSQLRMIFTACHPKLDARDQIAFALKTISGFNSREIASALLLKDETVKKRLVRARKSIRESNLSFDIPEGRELHRRLTRVHEIIYLIFNEGFHSANKVFSIRKELCGEALRLMRFVLNRTELRSGAGYALFALMCFHTARLESKISEDHEIIDLKNQDRSTWHQPLFVLGNDAMSKAMEFDDYSTYHVEAAIAAEHLKAKSYNETNWEVIYDLYKKLFSFQPDALTTLSIAFTLIQLKRLDEAIVLLDELHRDKLEQRIYLYYGVMAEYFKATGDLTKAVAYLDVAIDKVSSGVEKKYLQKKREFFAENFNS